ncbi:hypothetical protein EST38_g5309 [Candolleomyces aberdarensis]|uniref:F-box domain-containing protein n=1 Tax=Candolleomyces aberdarensis TaxID=2316362 RepID=A0A4Q2DMK5_9AGAR|nr:hypothetical protein EST38_g5309 [Candolleomyces aberdarensis]
MANSSCFILKLATETVTLIFQYAVTPNIDFDPQVHLSGHVEHGRLHYLGRVCRLWHDILCRTPSVWRHITMYVDTPHTFETISTSPLNIYLTRSATLTICVYLLRKKKVPHSLDLGERMSVQVLLSALEGHLERVEALVVETNQASSLPDFQSLLLRSGDAHSRLSRLRNMMFRCNADDSILQSSSSSSLLPSIHGRFEVNPTLTTVYIDGRNLLAMLQSSVSLRESGVEDVFSSMPMLETFGVNHLTFRVDGYSDERIHHFFLNILPSFPRLKTLALNTFEPNDDGHPWSIQGHRSHGALSSSPPSGSSQAVTPLVSTSVPRLIIKCTDQDSIEFVLKRIGYPRTLILIHCYFTFPSPTHISNCPNLVLVDIPTDFHRILPKMIAHWNGQHLELVDCPCVDDDFWAGLITELTDV